MISKIPFGKAGKLTTFKLILSARLVKYNYLIPITTLRRKHYCILLEQRTKKLHNVLKVTKTKNWIHL